MKKPPPKKLPAAAFPVILPIRFTSAQHKLIKARVAQLDTTVSAYVRHLVQCELANLEDPTEGTGFDLTEARNIIGASQRAKKDPTQTP